MNILERMAASGSEERIASFRAMQQRDYDFKVAHAEETAYKFLEHPQINGMAYVAVGGLDSITLLCFLRSIGIDLPRFPCPCWRTKASSACIKNWA